MSNDELRVLRDRVVATVKAVPPWEDQRQRNPALVHNDCIAAVYEAFAAYLNEKPHEYAHFLEHKGVGASPPHAAAERMEAEIARVAEAAKDAKPAATEPELRAENERLRGAILWALGYYDFPERQPGQGAYWWRIELAKRAAIQPLYASPSAQPIARDDPEAAWHTWRVSLPTGTGSAYDIAPYDAFLAGYAIALKSAGKEST